jgi:hypothetical protein
MLPMRPSIAISIAAHERSQHLREVYEFITYVLRVHKDDMQARSQSSTTPKLQPQQDKVSVMK